MISVDLKGNRVGSGDDVLDMRLVLEKVHVSGQIRMDEDRLLIRIASAGGSVSDGPGNGLLDFIESDGVSVELLLVCKLDGLSLISRGTVDVRIFGLVDLLSENLLSSFFSFGLLLLDVIFLDFVEVWQGSALLGNLNLLLKDELSSLFSLSHLVLELILLIRVVVNEGGKLLGSLDLLLDDGLSSGLGLIHFLLESLSLLGSVNNTLESLSVGILENVVVSLLELANKLKSDSGWLVLAHVLLVGSL